MMIPENNKVVNSYKIIFIFLSILFITNCSNDSIPDMITPLGINVWLNGHTVDPNELDQNFKKVVEGLGYGPTSPIFDLHIMPAKCEIREDGTEKCYFKVVNSNKKYAGLFISPDNLLIHLSNGAWTIRQSAYRHEVIHYTKYQHNRPDWRKHDGDGWDLQTLLNDMKGGEDVW